MRKDLSLFLLLTVSLFSCQREFDLEPGPEPPVADTTARLLPVFIDFSGEFYDSLLYDDQNRLIGEWSFDEGMVSKTVYTYIDDKPAIMESYWEFPGPLTERSVYTENPDGSVNETLTTYYSEERSYLRHHLFNERRQLVKTMWGDGRETQNLSWDDKGRPLVVSYIDNDTWFHLSGQYDDKKGMFSAVKTPFIFDLSNLMARFFFVNNPVRITETYIDGSGGTVEISEEFIYTYNEHGYPETILYKNRDGEVAMTIHYIEAR
ncbi:MAG: hypothetical protein KIT80_13730 [Chitinophagaceae bacterium]|nr:hypothetical protein [Chitinophagaceae bacterium]MCW5927970.1 hypothetical protein [Chitinophagaceae bacterium]